MVDTSLYYRSYKSSIALQATKTGRDKAEDKPTVDEIKLQIEEEEDYFDEVADDIDTVDDLLDDDRFLAVVLTAYDLEYMADAKDFLRKAWTMDPTKTDAETGLTLSDMADGGLYDMVTTVTFRTFEKYTFETNSVLTKIKERYEDQMYDKTEADNETEHVEVAYAADKENDDDDTETVEYDEDDDGNWTWVYDGFRPWLNDDARTEKSEQVDRETQNYLDKIGGIETVDDFLKSGRVFAYAMRAFGLEDMIDSKGMIRKVLESDLGDGDSYVNALDDDRFRKLAEAFRFRDFGFGATDMTYVKDPVVEQYKRQTMELTAGDDDEGARLALYFDRWIQEEAPPEHEDGQSDKTTRRDNILTMIGDNAVAEVLRLGMGLSTTAFGGDLESLAANIGATFDPADLVDDEGLRDQFIRKFIVRYELEQEGGSDFNGPLALLTDDPGSGAETLAVALDTTLNGGG